MTKYLKLPACYLYLCSRYSLSSEYNVLLQVPPPSIDFTLPSPTIGLPKQDPIDPPWIPHFKAKIEEVTVNQEQTVSLCNPEEL